MAKKISQLTQATEVKSDDVTVIVQDGETKKLPLNMMVTKQDIENKKVAGLAKLDEIEATYENDTYTPTITVENKSSVKTGEGDEVDYSANVMDGHVKSAILKGQTLVNLINYKGNFDGREIISDNTFKIDATKPFQELIIGKEYTFITYVSQTQVGNMSVVAIEFNEKDTGIKKVLCTINNPINGVNKVKFTVPSNYGSYLHSYIKTTSVGGSVTVKGMVIEGDRTQEDIPYFTGMQSVKMPVLTTTGKNLFKAERCEKTSLQDGSWVSYEYSYVDYIHTIESINFLANRQSCFSLVYHDLGVYGQLSQKEKVLFKKGVDYTMSFYANIEDDNNQRNYAIIICDENGKPLKTHRIVNKSLNVFTFNTNKDVFNIGFQVIYGSTWKFIAKISNFQIEETSLPSTYEPYKSNILTVNEEVTLRGIGDVKDTLDGNTGELTQRIGELVLDGDTTKNIYRNWTTAIQPSDGYEGTYVSLPDIKAGENALGMICSTLPEVKRAEATGVGKECVIKGNTYIGIVLKANSYDDLLSKLAENPITVQYQMKESTIKTVDLMPSGTHPSTTPYCWKNGHIQLSSSGLLPNLEYSVVTSRAGQINQNATMVVKNDKRIFDLEILLAGGLVNTTYQALTLQNQVETGLSKVSLSSETEPDYLLYHMIMKLIEEKAYKLDDLTEKVSVFYLYEKLSDEQFETIYSALYPFVEDEIVEEPVVEELPEVVEDEVIM